MSSPDYIELHARSAFSFLRGGSLPEQLAERAGELDLPALGVCDRMGVYGAPRFFNAAREQGLRPIIGAELSMEDGSVLPVLVESRRGYRNLCQLLTHAHLRAPAKNEGVVLWEELPEFAAGLVALTGDQEGPLVRAVDGRARCPHRGNAGVPACEFKPRLAASPFHEARRPGNSPPRTAALFDSSGHDSCSRRGENTPPYPANQQKGGDPEETLRRLVRIFGSNGVFVEIQRHLRRGEDRIQQRLIDLARAQHLPLLATNGVLHATPAGRQVVDVFTCLRHHMHLDAAGRLLSIN